MPENKDTLRIGFAHALAIQEEIIAARNERDLKTIQSVVDAALAKGELKVDVPRALYCRYNPA